MEITWYGHSCFQFTHDGMATVITDPYDHHVTGYPPLDLNADIVTISRKAPEYNFVEAVKNTPFIITGPGEYEKGDVFITGVQTTRNKEITSKTERNVLYMINYQRLAIAHLGDLNRVPSQAEIERLGAVHIALVPVGGGSSLNASRASELISLLDPKIVIPMHYQTPHSLSDLQPLTQFLKEMGQTEVETLSSFRINPEKSLPEEMKVVVLEVQTG